MRPTLLDVLTVPERLGTSEPSRSADLVDAVARDPELIAGLIAIAWAARMYVKAHERGELGLVEDAFRDLRTAVAEAR